jgi:hypothetical protein
LEIEKVEGPEKQTSTTVVFHYRFHGKPSADKKSVPSVTPSAVNRASPSSGIAKLYGLMREEFAAHGGGEAFLKRLRTDPEKDRR